MADCYYHGYSGGPGLCAKCEEEERRGLKEGTLGLTIDDPRLVQELADQSSIGRIKNKEKDKEK